MIKIIGLISSGKYIEAYFYPAWRQLSSTLSITITPPTSTIFKNRSGNLEGKQTSSCLKNTSIPMMLYWILDAEEDSYWRILSARKKPNATEPACTIGDVAFNAKAPTRRWRRFPCFLCDLLFAIKWKFNLWIIQAAIMRPDKVVMIDVSTPLSLWWYVFEFLFSISFLLPCTSEQPLCQWSR